MSANNTVDQMTAVHFPTNRNVKIGFLSAILFLTISGNLLTIMAICRSEKRKSAFLILVLNLAVADMSLTILGIPVKIHELVKFRVVTRTTFYCKVVWPMGTTFYCVSIFTIASMALHRCRAIRSPYRAKPRKLLIYCNVALTWIIALIMVIPLQIVAVVVGNRCKEKWPSQMHRQAYTVSLFLLQYVLPLLFITATYISIGVYLLNHQLPGDALETEQRRNQERQRKKKRNQAIRTLAAVVCMFTICYLPHQVAWLMLDLTNDSYQAVDFLFSISDYLIFIHSCINPFIYCLLNESLRQKYKTFLSSCRV